MSTPSDSRSSQSTDFDLDALFGTDGNAPIADHTGANTTQLTVAEANARRNIDPIAAAARIDSDYRRYLKTLLRPKTPTLRTKLNEAVDNATSLTKGPILDLTPPYAPGKSPEELVAEGVFSPSIVELGEALPKTRTLYQHQETAIRKLQAGRNLVVSTGTGSGKTESFLVPIIDHLLRQRDAGELGPGVRALLLYPMNALANDQVKRLREMLKDIPDITFGRYTGETEQTTKAAVEKYKQLNDGEEPLPNELVSREQMQRTPPHILLTNYAMLEYLLLRPTDSSLFDGENATDWSYIVIDEAHVYAGAQGAEIGMLLRRLKDRIRVPNKDIQCIATSASLEGTHQEVMDFGESIFAAPFEYVEDDPTRQDLVQAVRQQRLHEPQWSFTDGAFAAKDPQASLQAELEATATRLGCSLFEALDVEEHVIALRLACLKSSQPVADLGTTLWSHVAELDSAQATENVHQLVTIAARTTDPTGIPAISARYHTFVRATDGAFLGIYEDGELAVTLGRKVSMPGMPDPTLTREISDNQDDNFREALDRAAGMPPRPVYEFGSCSGCGAVHLIGTIDLGNIFRPGSNSNDGRPLHWVALDVSERDGDLNEDDEIELNEELEDEIINDSFLCFGCGQLFVTPAHACDKCGSHQIRRVKVYEEAGAKRPACVECGTRRTNLITRLITDNNLAPATLASSLFQLLPPAPGSEDSVGAGRKLLTFSDSRQAAAYAAPYLERHFSKLVERRLMLEGLTETLKGTPLTLEGWINRTTVHANQAHLRQQREDVKDEVREWIFGEATSIERSLSLEGLALASYRINPTYLESFHQSLNVASKLFGGRDAAVAYINLILKELRLRGALEMHEVADLKALRFEPRGAGWSVRYSGGGDSAQQLYSWTPERGNNYRTTLTRKFVEHAAMPIPDEKIQPLTAKLLETLWNELIEAKVLITHHSKQTTGAYVINAAALQVTHGDASEWFVCPVCSTVTTDNCMGLCPNANCQGTLVALDRDTETFSNHHFRWLARHLDVRSLRAEEHTAQLTSTHAADIQKQFIDGKINVLSCSTTFELGVDVGELQSVMMRNLPPRTANYVQRAGRAGRRAGSAAFVLTYARRSAHDLAVYQNPQQMIDGIMQTPYLTIENPRIATRHCYSVAFAAFLREYASDWDRLKKVNGLFLDERPQHRFHALMEDFLTPTVPEQLSDALMRIVPQSLHEELHITDGGWVTDYLDLIAKVEDNINQDHDELVNLINEAQTNNRKKQRNAFERTLATIVEQQTLGYLGMKNLLPKYGFPVDTVELDTTRSGQHGRQVELSRDLSLAIGDYAPGNTVVAAGREFTSVGVRMLAGRALEHLYFCVCKHCHEPNVQRFRSFEPDAPCKACDSKLGTSGTPIIQPRFGFVAGPKSKEVATTPPRTSWHRESYVLEHGDAIGEPLVYQGRGGTQTIEGYRRAEILVFNRGQEQLFKICAFCGAAVDGMERVHRNPRTGQDCTGSYERVALGHLYETDIALIEHDALAGWNESIDPLLSALYALLESASETLELNRDDIDGAIAWHNNVPNFVLFDAVPGGAGVTRKVVEGFDEVLTNALKRVAHCECDSNTSCYSCLRSYSNQRYHDRLRRRDAFEILESMFPKNLELNLVIA